MPGSLASRSTQVLIAGGGPVGLSAAVELGLRGISCVVVEPRARPTRTRPRAKTLNIRTMEHLRRWGVADRLRSVAPLPTWWSQDIAFCTSLLGTEITRFTGVLGLSDEGVSPELGQQAPQYVLEEMLREIVQDMPACTFLVRCRVTSLEPREDSVEVQVQHEGGRSETVIAEFVIGADGPRSVVREAIGARYEGTHAQRPNLGVMFRSAGLMDLLPYPPAVQSWLVNDRTPGVMGPVDRTGTWWLIAFGVDARPDDLDLQQLVEGALGRRVPVEIISTDPGLLDSYEAERRPLQQRVIAAAAKDMSVLSTQLIRDSIDDPGPRGERTRLMVAEQIRATKSAEYFSLDLVLGHQYRDSPVLGAGRDDDRADDDRWATMARPGRRIPHLWVNPGVSSLDLAGPGFTVITADSADAGALVRAAADRRVPMTAQRSDELARQFGADVIIIRPDQVVAWCGSAAPPDANALIDYVCGWLAADSCGTPTAFETYARNQRDIRMGKGTDY